MNGFLKRIILSGTAIILAFSLLVSSYGTTQVKAAALPAVYTSWELWVTLLSLLGICAYAEPANEEQAMQDVMNALYEMIKQYNGGQEPSEEELVYFTDLHQYFDASDNTLRIPEAAWDMYKIWGDAITKKPAYTANSGSINMSKMTKEEFTVWLRDFLGLSIYEQNSSVNSFCNYTYDRFSTYNFSGIIATYTDGDREFLSYPILDFVTSPYGIYETKGDLVASSTDMYRFSYSTGGFSTPSYLYWNESKNNFYCNEKDTARSILNFPQKKVLAFFINGYMYDFDSIFSYPVNLTSSVEWGNRVYFDEFLVPSNTISDALSSVTQSANNLNIADVFDTGTYEIITPGRTYDPNTETVTGDVVVSLPAPETIQQYSEGTITWQQMLEILNAQAIDTSTAMDLNSQEFINTQKGIANNVANIWSFLQSLLQGLLDMFLSLFIPSEGFFDGKFDELMDMFDGLGVKAYDISNLFDPDDGEPNNPFQDITIVVFDQEVVIVSFAHLPMFLNEFRPVIRGLLMLFLVYYCINQFLSLIRLAGMYDGSNQNSLPGTAIRPADKGGL